MNDAKFVKFVKFVCRAMFQNKISAPFIRSYYYYIYMIYIDLRIRGRAKKYTGTNLTNLTNLAEGQKQALCATCTNRNQTQHNKEA
jgi:hypothetical protein